MRQCSGCKRTKELNSFNFRVLHRGLSNRCVRCLNNNNRRRAIMREVAEQNGQRYCSRCDKIKDLSVENFYAVDGVYLRSCIICTEYVRDAQRG